MAENLNFNSKNGISWKVWQVLQEILEFSHASRKISKMQEIGHYDKNPDFFLYVMVFLFYFNF